MVKTGIKNNNPKFIKADKVNHKETKEEHEMRQDKWRQKQFSILNNSIDQYGEHFQIPSSDIKLIPDVETKWFSCNKYNQQNPNNYQFNHKFKKIKKVINCKTIKLFFTHDQRKVINTWLEAHRQMYNVTLEYIKTQNFHDQPVDYDWKDMRTKHLYNRKEQIMDNNIIIISGKEIKPASHVLDDAIQLACANYKSAFSNLRAGNIKRFRIRYWRKNKTQLGFKVEKKAFSKVYETFYVKSLGNYINIEMSQDIKLSDITSDCRLVHDKNNKQKEYTLYVPIKNDVMEDIEAKNCVGIDPGIRTFMTCYSNTEMFEIKYNKEKIVKQLELIDKVNDNYDIPAKKKRENERLRYGKITNLVNDLHWKTIKEILRNNKYIFIGDMSAKKIISKDSSILSNMDKRVVQCLSYYKFRQRLEYKCNLHGRFYKKVNECYTSQYCGVCKTQKRNLGGAKEYVCDNCTIRMFRDGNSARTILMRGLYETETK